MYNVKTVREIDALAKWDTDMVDIFEHYERYTTVEYLVSDELSGNVMKFIDETEATDFFDGLITQYTADGTALYDENGDNLVQIHSQQVNRIYQTIMAGNIVIRAYMTAMNDFPYVVYCGHEYIASMLYFKPDGILTTVKTALQKGEIPKFKIQVNPEQSEYVQKWIFANGGKWQGYQNTTVSETCMPYLFTNTQDNNTLTWGCSGNHNTSPEITFDQFKEWAKVK
jgi:hypothetical protein